MQLLMERSLENGEWEGLGVFPGDVVRFEGDGLKVPQIGWNAVEHVAASPLLRGIPEDLLFYFVHSYYCRPADPGCVVGRTEYGIRYASVLSRDNVHAAQFHPEKSGRAGLAFLKNFAEMPA
jgi:glutamine amidotransferase